MTAETPSTSGAGVAEPVADAVLDVLVLVPVPRR